ncbi:uncharacterized protein YndB with AHSA1/START domain [Haloactinopolyspora alba]|uniref:Uncharacterized protein YndB with AHSA1/START domain n=1 Tax=Haloactinopolyspora alba TaxID=648780 RepID=A0A2P8DWF6_9ACTN|nr:SRPBCC family protein [Haloactinopolyspora alba]PSL01548.1 uncharacterized protein YndB with AHSA1/START domain [Haloactinopolyspora alba]
MIEVDEQINAVRREVGSRVLEAGEARTTTVSQTYAADLEDVWDACTNPERIPRWFLPVSGELRLHGRYQLEGNAGGTIESCDPPHAFTATWEYGGEVSWIELRLTAEGEGRTRFELEHISHVDDDRWAQFGPGAVGVGWDMALIGLALHLGTGEAVDVEQVMAWVTGEESNRFIALSSERWGAASVAAGADAAEARAAAERTTAAYTATEDADVPDS